MCDSKVYNTSKIVFGEDKYADVQFIFNESGKSQQIVHAHATVLLIECPKLFKNIICGNIHGSCSVLMKNTNAEVFMVFLELLYLGHSEHLYKFFKEIAALFKEYEVPDTENKLAMIDHLTTDNICNVLQVCLDFEYDIIKGKALEFISNNFTEVVNSQSCVQSSKEVFKEILKIGEISDNYFDNEMQIVDTVARYIDLNSHPSHVGYEKFQPFQECIKQLRFPSMTIRQFAECMKKHKHILTGEESTNIFIEIAGVEKNQFGFSCVERFNEVYLLEAPNTEQIDIKFDPSGIENHQRVEQTQTIFCVNKPIVLKGLNVYNDSLTSQVTVMLSAKNKNKCLGSIVGKLDNGRQSWSSSFEFEKTPVLQPNFYYVINIIREISNSMEITQCSIHDEKIPETYIKDDYKLTFEKFSPLLRGLTVYKYNK